MQLRNSSIFIFNECTSDFTYSSLVEMSTLKCQSIKHSSGKFIYLTSEKRLFATKKRGKKATSYRCHVRSCKSQIKIIGNNECTYIRATHNHKGNDELKYQKLKILNIIECEKIKAIKGGKMITARELFNSASQKINSKLKFKDHKLIVLRRLKKVNEAQKNLKELPGNNPSKPLIQTSTGITNPKIINRENNKKPKIVISSDILPKSLVQTTIPQRESIGFKSVSVINQIRILPIVLDDQVSAKHHFNNEIASHTRDGNTGKSEQPIVNQYLSLNVVNPNFVEKAIIITNSTNNENKIKILYDLTLVKGFRATQVKGQKFSIQDLFDEIKPTLDYIIQNLPSDTIINSNQKFINFKFQPLVIMERIDVYNECKITNFKLSIPTIKSHHKSINSQELYDQPSTSKHTLNQKTNSIVHEIPTDKNSSIQIMNGIEKLEVKTNIILVPKSKIIYTGIINPTRVMSQKITKDNYIGRIAPALNYIMWYAPSNKIINANSEFISFKYQPIVLIKNINICDGCKSPKIGLLFLPCQHKFCVVCAHKLSTKFKTYLSECLGLSKNVIPITPIACYECGTKVDKCLKTFP